MTSRIRQRCLPVRARLWPLAVLWPLLAGGCSESAPARTPLVTALPDARWLDCGTDAACEARWLPCRGWRAVNRNHGPQLEAWYARVNADYLHRADCDGRPVAAPAAFCRARQCTLE
jgi:hypothetical protein